MDEPSKTLGGVPKQTFRPNLAASRNKKQVQNSQMDRLLQGEVEDSNLVAPIMLERSSPNAQPPQHVAHPAIEDNHANT